MKRIALRVLKALHRGIGVVLEHAQPPAPKSIRELVERARADYYGEPLEREVREVQEHDERLQIEDLTYSRRGAQLSAYERTWLDSNGYFEKLARKVTDRE